MFNTHSNVVAGKPGPAVWNRKLEVNLVFWRTGIRSMNGSHHMEGQITGALQRGEAGRRLSEWELSCSLMVRLPGVSTGGGGKTF